MSRPAALPALYVSYAVLQVFDVYSTRQALAQGAREANPLMAPVVRNQSAFLAVKTSAAVGTILAAEHLWKKKNNKKGAIAVLVASNAVAAVVAARNVSVLRSQR
jgi:anaerobic C4-dicarboxylate transporter